MYYMLYMNTILSRFFLSIVFSKKVEKNDLFFGAVKKEIYHERTRTNTNKVRVREVRGKILRKLV